MQSPQRAGWSGIEGSKPSERKRKGRNVDVLPTPPRYRQPHPQQLPTPETGHRHSKRPSKIASSSSTTLPTPETLPRKTRAKPQSSSSTSAAARDETDSHDLPSPSGHTTFYLSSSHSTHRGDVTPRRRPGLTFAQQMGLLSGSQQASSSTGFGGRLGAGVGIGGPKYGGHKVDQIARLTEAEDNPFIVSGSAAAALASPDHSTRHRPTIEKDASASPRSSRWLRSPPMLINDPIHSSMSLLSPPPTQRAFRIRHDPPPPSPETIARRKAEKERSEKVKRMRDEDDNPFLVKPGQRTIHRPGPIVDETKPTVTYVFRGAKKMFMNPFIDPNVEIPQSTLDPEDEDFEPHPCPKPKLLWPTAPTPPRDNNGNGLSTPKMRMALSDEEASPPSSPMPTPAGGDEHDHHDGKGFVSDDEFVPEHEHEELNPTTARRGLLFGPGAMKRSMEVQGGITKKRNRTGRM